jgi:AcrR family transcriptional regulator
MLDNRDRAAEAPARKSRSKLRRERDKQRMRERVLDAARELFALHGYEAVTMRKIADRIEYTTTMIYQHFPDKETLIREIVAHDFQSFAQEFRRCAQIADPIARILAMAKVFVDFGVQHPNHYRLMFMSPPSSEVKQANLAAIRSDPAQDVYTFFKQAIEEAMRKALLRPELDDPELLVQSLWSGMHGVVSLHIAKGRDPWIEWRSLDRISTLLVELLLRGIRRG